MKIFTITAAAAVMLLLVSCTDESDADVNAGSLNSQPEYEMSAKPGDTISETPPPPQLIPGEPVPPKGKD